jgi:hypothetical protein
MVSLKLAGCHLCVLEDMPSSAYFKKFSSSPKKAAWDSARRVEKGGTAVKNPADSPPATPTDKAA